MIVMNTSVVVITFMTKFIKNIPNYSGFPDPTSELIVNSDYY